MFKGLTSIIYKESIHILRDPKTLFLMLLIPSIQMIVFGYAIDLDVKHIATVVYNLDGRRESRELLDAMINSGYFKIKRMAFSDDELFTAIVRGETRVGIKIPPDYTDNVLMGRKATVQVLIDGSSSTEAMQALNVANAIALRESLQIVSSTIGFGSGQPIEMRPRVQFNPDMKTANFMVPGLAGIIMQMVTMLLTAFAIVREKETGTLEQLMVTPVARFGLMLGKLIPYGVIGALETSSVLLIMRLLFGVPIAGSVTLLAAFSLIFLFTALGLGLLISTFSSNQMQALQLAFLVMLPSVLLSGFVFPQENMPQVIWAVGQFLPVTYFIRILRGIIIRGAGFYDLWHWAAILGTMGLIILTISALRFRKTLS